MTRWLRWIASTVMASTLVACGGGSDTYYGSIAQVADHNGLTTLTAAADKAGLAPTLAAPSGTLTVFAPTNAAFDQMAVTLGFTDGMAMVDALDAGTLNSLLSYHVLGTVKQAATLAAGPTTQTTLYVNGGTAATLAVAPVAGKVTITDADLTVATVVSADVAASNGVVHVIDKVLVPPGLFNVVQMAQLNPVFSSLVGALVSADLVTTLSGPGPFTVFAPTDDAFAAIADVVASLTPDQLTNVLTYHVLGAEVLAADIPFGDPVTALNGQTFVINATTPPTITDTTATPADIVATDVLASNGVIHVIDKVLLPAL